MPFTPTPFPSEDPNTKSGSSGQSIVLPPYDPKASQGEAESGTENSKWMTPLRTFQAIASWVSANISITWNAISGKPTSFPPITHNHAISEVTNLQAALDGKQPAGDYQPAGNYATAEQGAKADSALQLGAAISTISGLQAALDGKQPAGDYQPAGNYATLIGGTVPASQLPSYVDDVLEYPALASFPSAGETGKIYVVTQTGKAYRWSGSSYVEIVASPGSTDAVPEGSTNLYFTAARAISALASTLNGYATQAWVTAQSYATTSSVTAAISALVTGVSSVAGKTGAVNLVKADVGLGNVDNTSDLSKPVSTATQSELAIKLNSSLRGAPNGVASLDSAGKVPQSQLPFTGLFELDADGDLQPIA